MAAEQGSEQAERRHGEAAGAGGHRIPRGGGRSRGRPCDGCSARSRPAAAHARQGGALRPGAPSGRARAAAPDTDGDRHDARGSARARLQRRLGPGTPRLSGGAGAGAPPAFSAGGGEVRPTEAPTPGDEGAPSGGGGSVPAPRRTVDRRWAARPPPARPTPPRWRHPARRLPPRSGGAGVEAPAGAGPGVRVREEVAAAARAGRPRSGLGAPPRLRPAGLGRALPSNALRVRHVLPSPRKQPRLSPGSQASRSAPSSPPGNVILGGVWGGSSLQRWGSCGYPPRAPPRASRTGSSRRPGRRPGIGGGRSARPAPRGSWRRRGAQRVGAGGRRASGLWAGRAGPGEAGLVGSRPRAAG